MASGRKMALKQLAPDSSYAGGGVVRRGLHSLEAVPHLLRDGLRHDVEVHQQVERAHGDQGEAYCHFEDLRREGEPERALEAVEEAAAPDQAEEPRVGDQHVLVGADGEAGLILDLRVPVRGDLEEDGGTGEDDLVEGHGVRGRVADDRERVDQVLAREDEGAAGDQEGEHADACGALLDLLQQDVAGVRRIAEGGPGRGLGLRLRGGVGGPRLGGVRRVARVLGELLLAGRQNLRLHSRVAERLLALLLDERLHLRVAEELRLHVRVDHLRHGWTEGAEGGGCNCD
mmetsp:Transcript_20556/g.45328  ORF Transcript_20556/g.45328 Transcript_20556/m.45328 type:complete len:287 (+) Transcript_20556:3-863(+)